MKMVKRKLSSKDIEFIKEHQSRHFCKCGCGEKIKIIRQHQYRGIPRYILNHYAITELKNKSNTINKRKYNDEEILIFIRKKAIELGRTPLSSDFKNTTITFSMIQRAFRTIGIALEKAGLEPIPHHTRESLIKQLQDMAKKIGRVPRQNDTKLISNAPSFITYYRYFGSWNNAIKSAGMQIYSGRKQSNDEMIKSLQILYKTIGRIPTKKDINKSNYCLADVYYIKRFESLKNAFKLAGIPTRSWDKNKNELKQDLISLSLKLERTPTYYESTYAKISANMIKKYYGCYNNLVKECGLEINQEYRISYGREDLLKKLKEACKTANRNLSTREFNIYNLPSPETYANKFGSVNNARKKIGLPIIQASPDNPLWKPWQQHCIKMAKVMFGEHNVELRSEEINGIPDIHIPRKRKHVDAKTTGYDHFQDQIDRYTINGYKLDFWCIHKGIENIQPRVRYYYSEDLAKIMEILGREDFAKICYQFKQNAYSIEQKKLNEVLIENGK